jgi:hypothetical protein
MTNIETATASIEIRFTGAGEYWLSEVNGDGVCTLGECATEDEVRAAVADVMDAGTGEETWFGWVADRG